MKTRSLKGNLTLGLAAFVALCTTNAAQAQIGSGNVELSLDNEIVYNGLGSNEAGASVALGTTLTGSVTVQGVNGNQGTTKVTCYANGSEIYYDATAVNLTQATFSWTPATAGTYTVYCSADYTGEYANGTVSTNTITVPVAAAPTGVQGLVYPKYVVVGVTYAPPGTTSFVNYSGTTSVGTTSTYSSAFSDAVGFEVSVAKSLNLSGIPGMSTLVGGGINIIASKSTTETQAQNSSSTITLSKSNTNGYQTSGYPTTYSPNGPPPPALPDDYDLIWVFLNPTSLFTIIPATSNAQEVVQWNGYGYDPTDIAGPDIYPIQVGCLNGHFTATYCSTQQGVLNRSWEAGHMSPTTGAGGTAPGCSPQTAQSPSICPNTQDAYNILAADPLAYNPGSKTYTLLDSSPLPVTTSDGRFTQLGYPPNPLFYEPNETKLYTASQSDTESQSNGGETKLEEKISLSINVSSGFLGLFKSSTTYTYTDTVTHTNSWLDTLTTSTTLTNAISITGSTPPNYVPGEFIGYQDNQFGTFMFYPSN